MSKSSTQGSGILLYGPPKIGKTTLVCDFPRPTVIFATERGHKFIPRSKDLKIVECLGEHGWKIFQQEVKKLRKGVKTVAIDTLNFLYSLCFNSVCASHRVTHPNQKGEFSKAIWHNIRTELGRVLGDLLDKCAMFEATCFFVTHSEVQQMETRSRDYKRTTYSIPYQLKDSIPPNVDCIWCMTHLEAESDEDAGKRVLYLKGDNETEAGTRDPSLEVSRITLTKNGKPLDAYQTIERAFKARKKSK